MASRFAGPGLTKLPVRVEAASKIGFELSALAGIECRFWSFGVQAAKSGRLRTPEPRAIGLELKHANLVKVFTIQFPRPNKYKNMYNIYIYIYTYV